jgi:hypothetical protein
LKRDNDINLIDLASNAIDEKGQYILSMEKKSDLSEGLGAMLVDADFDETSCV